MTITWDYFAHPTRTVAVPLTSISYYDPSGTGRAYYIQDYKGVDLLARRIAAQLPGTDKRNQSAKPKDGTR
jgi:hypothetical protein